VLFDLNCVGNAQCFDAELCTSDRCAGGSCANRPILYGDVNYDVIPNTDDALCVLDTFAGITSSVACRGATVEDADIAPCPGCLEVSPGIYDCGQVDSANTGDGFVNLDDALTVLDVFGCNCSNANISSCVVCGLGAACPGCLPPIATQRGK